MIESKIVLQQFDHINWCSPNQKQNFVLESISRSSPWDKEAQHWGPAMMKERKRQKSENIEKGIQRKLQWCFQQTWWRNILEIHAHNYKIFFVSYKLNRPWWKTDIYENKSSSSFTFDFWTIRYSCFESIFHNQLKVCVFFANIIPHICHFFYTGKIFGK